MKLQMVTVGLDDGQQGVFVGWPLLQEQAAENSGQIENIWFSNLQTVPDNLTLEQLMELVRKQLCSCMETLQ
ncbi:MAG: hypothetical protein WBN90_01085 [Gammaproteobacteria bacterium]